MTKREMNLEALSASAAYLVCANEALSKAFTRMGHCHRDTKGLGMLMDRTYKAQNHVMAVLETAKKLRDTK